MQLQRRLGGLWRDLSAIEAKVASMKETTEKLSEVNPQEADQLRRRLSEVELAWGEMKKMLAEREERLRASEELQRFLQNLDHFQVWLSKAQTTLASQDLPNGIQLRSS